MKCLLINPCGLRNTVDIHPPLNLAILAAHVKQHGHEVRIVDEIVGQDYKEILDLYHPDVVGITATTPRITRAYEISDDCRRLGFYTVLGGVHVSVLPEEGLEHADSVVIGDGEEALVKILDGCKEKTVQGEAINDLDKLSFPAYDLLDMKYYSTIYRRQMLTHLHFLPSYSKVASVMMSRGCPYSCKFCCNNWKATKLRFHSVARALDELEYLKKQYRIDAIFFFDDNIFANKKWLKSLCEGMIERNLNLIWSCQSTVTHLDAEILALCKKAGCRQIQFGMESGSPRILEYLKNGRCTVENNRRVARICKEIGILSFASFIIGNPDETLEDIRLTEDLIKELQLDFGGALIATPFPGTEFWRWAQEHGRMPEHLHYNLLNTANVVFNLTRDIPSQILLEKLRDINNYFLKRNWALRFNTMLRIYVNKGHKVLSLLKTMAKRLKRQGGR